MMPKLLGSCLISLVLSLASTAGWSAELTVGRLDHVQIFAPTDAPSAMAIHLSGAEGWRVADDAMVQALNAQHVVVLGIDLARYEARLDEDDGECLYVVGELTDLAQTAQRQLGIQTYLPPILTGRDEGATFAYAALADAPANTLGGAVGSGFANRLSLKLPFCPGASATRDGDAYVYGFDKALPERGTLFVGASRLDEFAKASAQQGQLNVEPLDLANAARQLASVVANFAQQHHPFGDIPAIDLPSSTPPRALAVLVSGDGGWRDIDKSIGEWLSSKGVHVVGLDALHYFWAKRTPQDLARDVGVLVQQADPAGELPVMLIGYSFGADTLPFAYPVLDKRIRDRAQVVALLAPGRTTSFQVTVSGWLGISDSGYDIVPAIAALPPDLVLCVYGKEDAESACADRLVHRATVLRTQGGHHFDGDYAALAQTMLERLPSARP